ncbi:MAG: shikimate dehydrogenase [Pseudonocardiales bacterium]|nr:shikimate dehydrogenase [Pseudonocardiales bacterium]
MASRSHAAVLGRPIGHSLSPVLHRAAYRALGLDWTYEAIDCGVDDLAAVLGRRSDWAGFSCTMPLKHVALQVADDIRPVARAVGAANTLLPRSEGGWIAENTDVAGIVAALSQPPALTGRVTLLGAGGSAQAVLVALAQLGVRRCGVLVRDAGRAARLRATATEVGIAIELGELAADSAALTADLVVSALPAGAADPLAGRAWSGEQAVLDVVYDGWPTPLAAAVAAAGGTVRSGALMLLHQAAAQVELMTGEPAPLEAMRAALLAASPNCGA